MSHVYDCYNIRELTYTILEAVKCFGIKQKKILVVDDEIDSNPSLKLVLEENGFKVDVFKDPLSVLEKIKTNLYDLLIIDTNMSKINGLTLYDVIKRIDNKAMVCFITASQTYA